MPPEKTNERSQVKKATRPLEFTPKWLWVKVNRFWTVINQKREQISYLKLPSINSKFLLLIGLFSLSILLVILWPRFVPSFQFSLSFSWTIPVAWIFYIEIIKLLLINLVKAFLWFLEFGALLSILRWLSGGDKGTLVLPFDNLTGNPRYNSPAVADTLVAEFHRIRHIHSQLNQPYPGIDSVAQNIAPITPNHEDLNESLNDIGTIGIGETQVSIGPLLMAMRRFWFFGHSGRLVTGSIHQHGTSKYSNVLEIVARIEDRQVRAWEASQVIKSQEDWTRLIREIAFKLIIHLQPNISASSWQSFEAFTEAIARFNKYQNQQNIEELENAYLFCKKSLGFQPNYQKIANLLCRIGNAFYRDSNINQEERYKKAENAFTLALNLTPNNAYAHNGLGNIYYERRQFYHAEVHYKIAQHKNSQIPYPYNGLGNVYADQFDKTNHVKDFEESQKNYEESIFRDIKFPSPYYNLGLLYGKRYKRLRKRADQQKKTLENNTHLAIYHLANFKSTISQLSSVSSELMIDLSAEWIFCAGYEINKLNKYEKILEKVNEAFYKSFNYHKSARELAPECENNSNIYFALGWTYFIAGAENLHLPKKGNKELQQKECYELAIREYEEAIGMDRKSVGAYASMGITYLYFKECRNHMQLSQEAFWQAIELLYLDKNNQGKIDDCLLFYLYWVTLEKLFSLNNSKIMFNDETNEIVKKVKEYKETINTDDISNCIKKGKYEDLDNILDDIYFIKKSPSLNSHDDKKIYDLLESKIRDQLKQIEAELA